MELKGHVSAIALLYLYLILGFPPMVRYRIKNQKLPDRDGTPKSSIPPNKFESIHLAHQILLPIPHISSAHQAIH